MGLTRIAVRRPLTILMVFLMIIVMGYRAFTMLEVERLPKTDLPIVSVRVSYPGASSEDVATQIIKPLEDAVAGISGVDSLNSTASEGSGNVTLQFATGVNTNQAAIDVERAVAAAVRNLPSGASAPVVSKADPNAFPIMTLVLSGPQGQDALAEVANNLVAPRLQSVDGVAAVNVNGGRTHQINVYLDPAKMAAYGVSLTAVQNALTNANVTTPAGLVTQGNRSITVREVGQFTNLDDVRSLVVVSPNTGATASALPGQNPGGSVFLSDVATVQDSYSQYTRFLRYNGANSVSVGIVKTSDANTINVADGVRAKAAGMAAELPPASTLQVINDSSVYTRASVSSVQEDLILAILITGLVMLVFLHTLRSTFIVVLAIPTTIIATFLVMWVLGFTLNTMTLMALTLTIGILVDDSIVVLENTERHLKMGKTAKQAAIDGRAEIGLAAITITLVDVVVYLPVAFTSGIIGQYFRSYGLTIVVATLFSLIVSFTLTPMLAAQWLKEEGSTEREPKGLARFFHVVSTPIRWIWNGFTKLWDNGFSLLTRAYGATIRLALRNVLTQGLVLLIAAAAVAGGIYMVTSGVVGSEFMPQEDDGQFTVNITMPADSNLAAADAAARQVEQIIRANVPEAQSIVTNVGGGGGGFGGGGGNNAGIDVYLVDKNQRQRGIVQITNALRTRLTGIPDARTSIQLSSSINLGFSGGGGNGIQVQFTGSDINTLTALVNQAEPLMRQVPGVADVINNATASIGEAQLAVDRKRLADTGVTAAAVASGLRTALSGTQVGLYTEPDQTDIPVMVSVDPAASSNLNQLLRLPLTYLNNKAVILGQVVTQVAGKSPLRISKVNRELVLTISANASGRAAGDVSKDIETTLRSNMVFPSGYTFRFGGSTQQQQTAFGQLTGALALSIVLIYMLLVALYQSWLDPLAIMFALPVTVLGAFGGLLVTHRTLNVISLLGIVLLAGIVTKNAILIVDFANKLRREDAYGRKEALITAGRLRLRPVLMTTSVLICALLPLLFHSGAGSELRAPMAAVVIGGNITSTLLSLVLVPVVYNILNVLAELATKVTGQLRGTVAKETETPSGLGTIGGVPQMVIASGTFAEPADGSPAGGE